MMRDIFYAVSQRVYFVDWPFSNTFLSTLIAIIALLWVAFNVFVILRSRKK